MLRKNQVYTVSVESVDGQMQGVAHVDGQTLFIPGALQGETVTVSTTRCEKSYAFARILSVDQPSPERITPPCPHYQACGGCDAQHMAYEASLRAKQEAVRQVLRRVGGIDLPVPLPLSMETPFQYRNKSAYPVADTGDGPVFGFYAPRSHRLVPIQDCLIAKPEGAIAARTVCAWMKEHRIPAYDEKTGQGLIRHVVTRVTRSGETMVTVVSAKRALPHADDLAARLQAVLPKLASVCLSVQNRPDNVILGPEIHVLYGADRLQDTLCGLTFSLSPLSFFQVNPTQTEKLYQTALSFGAPQPHELAVDLYCGAGTISLLLARHARQVIGIEIVPEAIRDAEQNALRNGVRNAVFYAAPAETLLPQLVQQGLRPDLVFLDPPRKGVQPEVIRAIAQAAPSRVVYIGCDPATLARDLRLFSELGYQPQKCQPVDMFCWCKHVETVVKLTRAEP